MGGGGIKGLRVSRGRSTATREGEPWPNRTREFPTSPALVDDQEEKRDIYLKDYTSTGLKIHSAEEKSHSDMFLDQHSKASSEARKCERTRPVGSRTTKKNPKL